MIIGAGNVGNALGRALRSAEFTVSAVISRSHVDAIGLAEHLNAEVAATHVSSISKTPSNILCTVPDNEIETVAQALAELQRDWVGSVVMHTSGAKSSRSLKAVADRGALVASFHPLKSVPNGTIPAVLADSIVAIEGDQPAVSMATSLARLLHMRPMEILESEKPAYHLGASIASNFIVTLFAMANEIIKDSGFSDLSSGELYGMLAANTVDNVGALGPGAALTGPIARGDTKTVQIHLTYLQENLPHLLPVYSSLATETVRVATKAGKIDADSARTVLDTIHQALMPSIDGDFGSLPD